MTKTTKRFFVTETGRRYDGSVKYTPKCYKRFSTMEEAQARAEKLNKVNSKENREKMYRSWIEDPETEWFTEESYKRLVENDAFYFTYEAKESK